MQPRFSTYAHSILGHAIELWNGMDGELFIRDSVVAVAVTVSGECRSFTRLDVAPR